MMPSNIFNGTVEIRECLLGGSSIESMLQFVTQHEGDLACG